MRPLMLTARLRTKGPLAVAGDEDLDETVDRPVLRDQHGHPRLTGTGVAGAVRAAARLRYGDRVAADRFGQAADDRDTGTASPIVVHSPEWIAPRTAPDAAPVIPVPDMRDHVGIDRERLTAKTGILYDEETWPYGLEFLLRFECDEPALPFLLGALEELDGPLGGLGAGPCPVAIHGVAVHRTDWSPARAVRDAITRHSQTDHAFWPTAGQSLRTSPPAPAERLVETVAATLDVTLCCVDPLLCTVPLDPSGGGGDNWPFTVTGFDAGTVKRAVAAPGDSVRGVLRQRIERAWNLAGRRIGGPWEKPTDLDHPVLRLFGWSPQGRDRTGQAGVLHVGDFVGRWQDDCDPDQLEEVVVYPRVAHDRLTHSTFGSAKWEDTAVRRRTQLAGRITIAPLDRQWDDLDLACVARGLADLHRGAAGIGRATHSGYGTVEVAEATLTFWSRTPAGLVQNGDRVPVVGLQWPDELREPLREAWKRAREATAA